jgi:hypothetical protein
VFGGLAGLFAVLVVGIAVVVFLVVGIAVVVFLLAMGKFLVWTGPGCTARPITPPCVDATRVSQ